MMRQAWERRLARIVSDPPRRARLAGKRSEESGMMSEIHIHTIARQMLEQAGPEAIAQAAQKAQSCDSKGEADEAREWRHIAEAMKMMRGPHQS
jgi:hypothetical protein